MDGSRDDMRRMLEQAKSVVRARTASLLARSGRAGQRTFEDNMRERKELTKPSSNPLNAKDNQREFVEYYYRVICAFIEDKSKYELELPNLSGFDRLVVHALAEHCNLSHISTGAGENRVMHVKKDALFFQHPDAAQSVQIEDILAKATGKESKFHLRHARTVDPGQVEAGQIGSYADEDAARKIARLRRATDEYRHATEMGYTQEELLAMEKSGHGASVEELLRRGGEEDEEAMLRAIAAPKTHHSTSASSPTTAASNAAGSGSASGAIGGASVVSPSTSSQSKVYEEVCRSCGTRALVDYPIAQWGCSKYCAQCTRQTVWSLEAKDVSAPSQSTSATTGATASAAASSASGHRKRPRDGADMEGQALGDLQRAGLHTTSTNAVEEIDVEDDDDELLAFGDVMDMAAINDFAAEDVNWLRAFANVHTDRLQASIVFCIDFSDLAHLHIFRRPERAAAVAAAAKVAASQPVAPATRLARTEPEASGSSVCRYVVLREVGDLSLKLSALLEELAQCAFALPPPDTDTTASHPAPEVIEKEENEDGEGGSETTMSSSVDHTVALEHMALAFLNASVYGTEARAICQLRPSVSWSSTPQLTVSPSALNAMQRKYGVKHCYISASLSDAIKKADEDS